MKTLNPSPGNCRKNGVIGLGLLPDQGPATINIKLSHGLNHYQVFVPFSSSFGYLKSFICQQIGLRPEKHKLLFRGSEKEDDEDLQTAGLTDYCEVLLMEAEAFEQASHEEVESKGKEAVSEVRKEVDKLAQQVSSLQALVDRRLKVEDKEIVYLTEMLMRQLLKLDGIEAEREGRVERKMEVRRVQNLVEILDALKLRNFKLT
ncbi:BAG family molecular chaperone regulator 4 [Striga hermonthica]|uniref:BAG family molecular chaperone regulator 4 n=1 Tax=Striga hermonthica TaxID=68872 RepID=A0A9N7RF66_STRHE|nr:BAG family molecular chaperone regulator 4 [Striga hermonthica]